MILSVAGQSPDWYTQMNLVCVRTQVWGLPLGIAGLRKPVLAPCGYVVRVVILRFNLRSRRCKGHRLGT